MAKDLFGDGISRITPEDVAGMILERVNEDKVRVTCVFEPGRTELTVEPWEPYRMECPYKTDKESSI